jgi:DNA-binding MarR family transcriptional regulator
MRIEDEIKQDKFKSNNNKLLVNIIFTGNWINQLTSRFLRKYGLTPQQYNILRILRGQKPNPSTIMLLQDRMLDRLSNASRLVDKLKGKGLVDRKINGEDRRRVDVTITKKGMDLLASIEKTNFEDKFANLTEAEADKVNSLLDKMRG